MKMAHDRIFFSLKNFAEKGFGRALVQLNTAKLYDMGKNRPTITYEKLEEMLGPLRS